MALTDVFCDMDLATGADDGTSKANAYQTLDSMTTGIGAQSNIHVKIDSRGGRHTTAVNSNKSPAGAATTNPIVVSGWNFGTDLEELVQIDLQTSQWVGGSTHMKYRSLDLLSNVNGYVVTNINTFTTFENMIIDNAGTTGAVSAMQITDVHVRNCVLRATNNGGLTEGIDGLRSSVRGCMIITKDGTGINSSNTTGSHDIQGNIFIDTAPSSGATAIWLTGSNFNLQCVEVSRNHIYNYIWGIYIDNAPNVNDPGWNSFENNAMWLAASGVGLTVAAGIKTNYFLRSNAIGGVSGLTRYSGLTDVPELGAVVLTANPWTDPTNGDFSLNSAAGGGALLKSVAYPTDFNLDGTQDNFKSIGATQDEAAGGVITHPGFSGGIRG